MRDAAAEFLGTALLLAIVVGSGIQAERLAGGNAAIALLANSLATAAGLIALLLVFGPVSGAHLNPIVSVAAAGTGSLPWRRVPIYAAAQFAGAFAGVVLAHAMFELPAFAASPRERSGAAMVLAEGVATYGLVLVVLGCGRSRPAATPFAVAAIILCGYWFTASTSFANPAVTLARTVTDTFTGIRLADAPGFVLGQVVGALAALATFRVVLTSPPEPPRG